MINLDDNIYDNKQLSAILRKFVLETILKQELEDFALEEGDDNEFKVSHLMEFINYELISKGEIQGDAKIELNNFVEGTLDYLHATSYQALAYYIINKEYEALRTEFKDLNEKEFKDLLKHAAAHPKQSIVQQLAKDALKEVLANFISEFDLCVIKKDTVIDIHSMIYEYVYGRYSEAL